ncbi:MAG: hypothetical protein ACLFN1_02420 [Bacteroidales bacterium]
MHWGIFFTVPVQGGANNVEMRQGGEQSGYDISRAGLECLRGDEGTMPGMPGFYNTYSYSIWFVPLP